MSTERIVRVLLENAEPGIRDSLPEGDADRLLRLLTEGLLS